MNPAGFASAIAGVTMSETRDLITLDASTLVPAVIFAEGGVDKILADLTRQVRAVSTDISTPQGRADIKSLAYKIARSKTALDSAGKQLGEDWRKRVEGINSDRRRIRDELDALADEVRAPLMEWENVEKARVEGHEAAIAELFGLAHFEGEPLIDQIDFNLTMARGDARDWQEFAKRAADTKTAVLCDLTIARDHWTQVYADRAEAARVAAEEAARVQREREAAIAARAAEEAKREAEAKAAREAAAAEERSRRQREAAAEKARQERAAVEAKALAEREAALERERRTAEKVRHEQEILENARLAEVRARQEAEERARLAEITRKAEADTAERNRIVAAEQAERDRLQAIEDERARVAAEQQALADAGAAREADRKHKAKVEREAAVAIAKIPGMQVLASQVVSAIARGLVPHCRITY